MEELKNKILSSSNFNNLENSEDLPRIRALRKSSVFQNSAADMETKRPHKPKVDDIVSLIIIINNFYLYFLDARTNSR